MERLTIIIALALAACAGEGDGTAGDSTTTTTTGGSSTSSSTSTTTTTTTGGESSSTTGAPVGCEAAAAWCFTEFTDDACNHCRVECDERAAENPCSTWEACAEMQGEGCGCAHFWCAEGLGESADDESRIGICKACVEVCDWAPSKQSMCEEKI